MECKEAKQKKKKREKMLKSVAYCNIKDNISDNQHY